MPEPEEPELSTTGAAESCASDNPDPYVSDVDDMEEELRSTGTDVTFGEFVATDFNLTTCDPQTVPYIMPEIRQGEVSWKGNDEDKELERPPAATFAQAVAALDFVRSFFDHRSSCGAERSLQTLEKELFFSKRARHSPAEVDRRFQQVKRCIKRCSISFLTIVFLCAFENG